MATGIPESRERIEALRDLLREGGLSTQEDLREKLEKSRFNVTQSTVSRDLRKIGAIKAFDAEGRTVYQLPEEFEPSIAPVGAGSLGELVREIQSNGMMIVIHTTPGSASLVARHLDHFRPGGILGTLAGDDTIFVAPASMRSLRPTLKAIEQSLGMA
jgi:transcriptional regulator of arginine metabolism